MVSILIAGELVAVARREALREAADLVDRFADQIMKQAEAAHEAEDYDSYEALEGQATLLMTAVGKIRNRAKRGERRSISVSRPPSNSEAK